MLEPEAAVDLEDAAPAAPPPRHLGAWALLTARPGTAVRWSGTALVVGITLEVTLRAMVGPMAPAGAAAGSGAARWSAVALVWGAGGLGIAAWFARWLVAVLVLAWLMARIAQVNGAAPAGAEAGRPAVVPPLPGRLAPLLAVLVALLAVVLLPWSALLVLGLPWWLAGLVPVWPSVRLALAPPAAVLTAAGARRALAVSWRATRRRELFVAWWALTAWAPLAVLALVVLVAAVYLPAWFSASWWLALCAAWLYLPLAAARGVWLWWRLGPD